MAMTKRNIKPRRPENDAEEARTSADNRANRYKLNEDDAEKLFEGLDVPIEDVEEEEEVVGDEESGEEEEPRDRVERTKNGDDSASTGESRRYVNLGGSKVKLSRKQTEQLQALRQKGGERRGYLDSIAGALQSGVRKASGQSGGYSTLGKGDTKRLVICLPCPSLAWEYLVRLDGFPLGIVMQLNAKWGTGKSALAAEFFRWFDMADGFGNYNENETKHNPQWFTSIHGQELYDRLTKNRCDSVDGWQSAVTNTIRQFQSYMEGTKKAPGPGRIFPLLSVVDSIMGKLSKESQEKIMKDGFAGRGFPIEALAISRYMQTIPTTLDGWPISILLINHLKEKTDSDGRSERHFGGGKQLGFQESLEIEMQKTKSRIDCSDFEGFEIRLVCEKNSIAPGRRSVVTRVLWWYEEEPESGELLQKTVWDWDWATVKLLHSINNVKGYDSRSKARLKEVNFHIDCPKTSDVENLAWSKTLGITEANAVPWNEMGALIRQNPDVMRSLRKALCIHRMPFLSGAYNMQLEELNSERKPKRRGN